MTKSLYIDMTDEEVLNHAARAIHDYLMRIRPQHGKFVLEDCMARQISELKLLFRHSRGLGRRDSLSPQDIKDLDLTINHLGTIYLFTLNERNASHSGCVF